MHTKTHSPLPWIIEESGFHDAQVIRSADGLYVAQTRTKTDDDGCTPNDCHNPHDAEYIVRAANAFPALVEALKALTATIDAHQLESLDCDRSGETWCDCLARQQAIAKAALAAANPEKV